MLAGNPHYHAIAEHYGDRRAERSGVPLLRHVDEGLAVLEAIDAPLVAREAYCLHPLLQGDAELAAAFLPGSVFHRHVLRPHAVALAMEYRAVANGYLSHRTIDDASEISLGPLPEVRQMLIADKVQNRKDFERYHAISHPRARELDRYFRLWLDRLGVSEAEYGRFVTIMEAVTSPDRR
jgi:hypothetical protein